MVNLGSNMYNIEEALCGHIKSNARFVKKKQNNKTTTHQIKQK